MGQSTLSRLHEPAAILDFGLSNATPATSKLEATDQSDASQVRIRDAVLVFCSLAMSHRVIILLLSSLTSNCMIFSLNWRQFRSSSTTLVDFCCSVQYNFIYERILHCLLTVLVIKYFEDSVVLVFEFAHFDICRRDFQFGLGCTMRVASRQIQQAAGFLIRSKERFLLGHTTKKPFDKAIQKFDGKQH